jgi:hypothetical protein
VVVVRDCVAGGVAGACLTSISAAAYHARKSSSAASMRRLLLYVRFSRHHAHEP